MLLILVRLKIIQSLSLLFLTKDDSSTVLSTYNLAVEWESVWGSWLTWINLALVVFLSFRSIYEVFSIIMGSLNKLST